MLDIAHQIAHWRDGALEEWQGASELFEKGRMATRCSSRLCAREGAQGTCLPAHRGSGPRTHNLARPAEVAAVEPTTSHLQVLSILNEFSQAGRYLDDLIPLPTLD